MFNRQSKAGGMLVVTMIMVVILGAFGAGLMNLGMGSGLEVSAAANDGNAFEMAQAGLERFRAIIRTNTCTMELIPPAGHWWGQNVLSGTNSMGFYSVSTMIWTNSNGTVWDNTTSSGAKRYKVISVGTSTFGSTNSRSLTLCAVLPRLANFSHSSAHESNVLGRVYFGTGDVIDGMLYVNDQINVDGSGSPKPRFLKPVFSHASSVYYYNGVNSSNSFEGGLSLNAVSIDQAYDPANITNVKSNAETYKDGLLGISSGTNISNYNVIFTNISNVGYVWYKGGMTTNPATYTNYAAYTKTALSNINGAIYFNSNATVQGVVNGNVTLAAQNVIYITNGITYASAMGANDPWQTNTFNISSVDDTLGLLASNAVQVCGSTDVTIAASIMVTSGSVGTNIGFGAVNWNVTNSPSLSVRPKIHLFGSLAQYYRGVVGQGTRMGFSKDYKYDTRLYTLSPPYYPLTHYQFTFWGQ